MVSLGQIAVRLLPSACLHIRVIAQSELALGCFDLVWAVLQAMGTAMHSAGGMVVARLLFYFAVRALLRRLT